VPTSLGSVSHVNSDFNFMQVKNIDPKGVIPIEIKIPKEIRDYQESIVFGLSLRQCVFSLLAIGVAVLLYFGLRNFVGDGEIGWICIVAAFPFALGGFFRYNGMNFEQFMTAVIRSELRYPKQLKYKTENLYVKCMEDSSLKEVLTCD